MRKAVIYIILGIFFIVVAVYIIKTESPFKVDMIQDLATQQEIPRNDYDQVSKLIQSLIDRGIIFEYLSVNTYIVAALLLFGIFCLFTTMHLIVDKFFFKKFYENPTEFDAIRRALLFSLTIGLMVFFNLYRIEVYVVLSVPLFFLIFELLTGRYFKKIYEKFKEKFVKSTTSKEISIEKNNSYEDFLNRDIGYGLVEEPEDKVTKEDKADEIYPYRDFAHKLKEGTKIEE